MTPAEVITLRGNLYLKGDYEGIYDLYSRQCELREFFQRAEDYARHVRLSHHPDHELISAAVHSERIRGTLAEVVHTEKFMEHGSPMTYETRSFLKFEEGAWKILKEERDKVFLT